MEGPVIVAGTAAGAGAMGSGEAPVAGAIGAMAVVVVVVVALARPALRVQAQNDVHAFAAVGAGIVFRGLLPEKLDRFADARIAKLDLRNDDGVELGRDPRRAGGVFRERIGDRGDGLAIFFDRLFPAFLDLPELARTRLVVRLLAVMRLGEIDASSGGRAATLYGSRLRTCSYFLNARS